jgi:2-phosphosulfolactate phosphatase
MDIRILQFIEGAKEAVGLTVIIDVFRAFSLECYLYDKGVECIIPLGNIEDAYKLKEENKDRILIGERKGKKCEGFDYGNSPSQIKDVSLKGKTIIHTTSAGTQGIANAKNSDEIITGSLVNAKAIVEYIKKKNPEIVSLVCMGNAGIREANEDILCANYIKSLLLYEDFDIESKVLLLKEDGGEHFFNPNNQDVYPEEDFWMCIKVNIFPFVLKIEKNEMGKYVSRKVMTL